MNHVELENYLGPYRPLREDVKMKSLARLKYEGYNNDKSVATVGSSYVGKPELFAMERYSYFQCFKCNKVPIYFSWTSAIYPVKLRLTSQKHNSGHK